MVFPSRRHESAGAIVHQPAGLFPQPANADVMSLTLAREIPQPLLSTGHSHVTIHVM